MDCSGVDGGVEWGFGSGGKLIGRGARLEDRGA